MATFKGLDRWKALQQRPFASARTLAPPSGDASGFKRYVEEPGKWMDEDGSILKPVGTGSTLTHQFEALYYVWQNFHAEEPAASFRLDGITANVVVVHLD